MDNTVIIKKSRLNKVMKLGGVEVKLIRNDGIYFLASNESMLDGNSAEDKAWVSIHMAGGNCRRTEKYVYFLGEQQVLWQKLKIIKKRKAYCKARGIYPTSRDKKNSEMS